MEKASVASLLNVSYKDNIKPQEWFLSFPPYKCFPTFAVWKHFSIYPYPRKDCLYLTANSSFSSLSSQGRAMEENLTLCLFKWAGLLSFAILTARSSSDMIHRCISIKHDFYKGCANLSLPYKKTQDEWSCWTPTKSGSSENISLFLESR